MSSTAHNETDGMVEVSGDEFRRKVHPLEAYPCSDRNQTIWRGRNQEVLGRTTHGYAVRRPVQAERFFIAARLK